MRRVVRVAAYVCLCAVLGFAWARAEDQGPFRCDKYLTLCVYWESDLGLGGSGTEPGEYQGYCCMHTDPLPAFTTSLSPTLYSNVKTARDIPTNPQCGDLAEPGIDQVTYQYTPCGHLVTEEGCGGRRADTFCVTPSSGG